MSEKPKQSRKRSFPVKPEMLPLLEETMREKGFKYRTSEQKYDQLAEKTGLSIDTVEKFLQGKPTERNTIELITTVLDLRPNDIVKGWFSATSPKPKSTDNSEATIDQSIFQSMLDRKIRELTANIFLSGNLQTAKVYVPLGLIERKEKSIHKEVTAERGSELYRANEYEVSREFENDQFLTEVLLEGNSPKSQGRRITIIGEPGSGKSTRLQQIAMWCMGQSPENHVIWISLADLRNRSLEDYLLRVWLKDALNKRETSEADQDEFIDIFNQGNVWLLLDGIDEMSFSENPLAWVDRQIRGWIDQAKIITTCRTNVWDGNRQALNQFDVYRNLDFSNDQRDQFIGDFLDNKELSKELINELNKSGKERIRDLVRNPLRLTLICRSWQKRQGSLPNTKAGLYQECVEAYYDWKEEPETTKFQRKELHKALGELAKQALDRNHFRFRLTESQISEVLGESDQGLFKLALDLGWLNEVGRAEEHYEKIFAFFHPSFQEYFAALAIDDPDYLLKHLPKNPEKGTYKILEPQWREIALLWISLPSVNNDQKNKLMNQLAYFDYEPKSAWIYQTRALLIATELISEFHDCGIADEILGYSIDCAFGEWDEEKKELIYHPKGQDFRDKIKLCSHPQLLKKLESKLEFLSKNVSDFDLINLAKFILEKNPKNAIVQKIVDHYPQWFNEKTYTEDDYYQYCGFDNYQDFIKEFKLKYGEDYGTPLFWQRYEQRKQENVNKPRKTYNRYIPNKVDYPKLFVNDDDSNSWGIDDSDQDDFKSISELINNEIWISNNALKNQSVIELFEREPSHLFSCAGLRQFLDWAIFGQSNSLMNIIKDNLANFDSDKNYNNHIEDAFFECLSGMSDYIAWQVGDDEAMTTIEGRPNLMYQTLIYDYFCYKNPESKLSMGDYLQTLEQSKFKELYSAVPENVFALAMKTTNLNIFLTIFAFLIDLSNKYGVIKPKLMNEIISRFFEFDINFYISTEIADYLADRINYSEFHQRWRDHNKLSGQMTMNHFF